MPAAPAVPVRGRTGAFERLRALPDHRVVDRLLRSRGCIWVIGIMLGGIVAMQVSQLRLNAGISRAVTTQNTLELVNSKLQAQIAELSSPERITAAALAASMVDPPAGDRRFLTARPATDPLRALHRMKPPSQSAIDIMGNGGREPGALAAGATGAPAAGLGATTAAPTTPNVAAAPTAAPATLAQAAPVATPVVPAATAAPPVATVAPPVATAAPPVETVPGTGAAVAPAGQG